MILRCHYDSALRPHGKHKAGAVIYHSSTSDPPEKVGSITDVVCRSPPNRVASTAEGEYCAQFVSGQTAYWHRVISEQVGYRQPPTILPGDNTTAVGVANDSLKVKRSKATNRSYHWTRDRTRLGELVPTRTATELSGSDYQTKSLSVKEHSRQVKSYVKFPPPDPTNPP